jgi:hypothetical protein
MRRRVWVHRAAGILWAALLIPAVLWWPTSVLFVIVSSVWANVYAPLATAEAADQRALMARLDRIETLLKEVRDAAREGQQQEGDLQEHQD